MFLNDVGGQILAALPIYWREMLTRPARTYRTIMGFDFSMREINGRVPTSVGGQMLRAPPIHWQASLAHPAPENV